MDYSLPGSSVHEVFPAKILEWVAISFSRGASWPNTWQSSFLMWRMSPQKEGRVRLFQDFSVLCQPLNQNPIALTPMFPSPLELGNSAQLQSAQDSGSTKEHSYPHRHHLSKFCGQVWHWPTSRTYLLMLNASQGQHGTLWGQLQALHRSLPTNHSQKNHMLLMLSPWSQSGVGEIQTERLVNIHHFSVKCKNTKSTWEQQWSNQEKEEKLVPVSQSLKFRHLQHCVLGSGARGTEGCLVKKRIPGLHHRPTGSYSLRGVHWIYICTSFPVGFHTTVSGSFLLWAFYHWKSNSQKFSISRSQLEFLLKSRFLEHQPPHLRDSDWVGLEPAF